MPVGNLGGSLLQNRRDAARARTAARAEKRASRQASSRRSQRTARRKTRQEQRTARASGRQTTRQMKIKAKGESGYWSPEAVGARSQALSSTVESVGGAVSDIFGDEAPPETQTEESPYMLILGVLAAGGVVYLITRPKKKGS